jgi:hypothetical protein
MNNPVKSFHPFEKPKRYFLQVTHLCIKDHSRLQNSRFCQVFHSDFNSKARGVAILVSKIIHFSTTNVISGSIGRYLIITGTIWQTPVVVVNIYAPNFDDVEFTMG